MNRDSKTAGTRNRQMRNPASVPAHPRTSKLDQIASLLAQRKGASIAEMTSATGWQLYSVRGALDGALKRRGLVITSDKVDGVRRYKSGETT